MSIQILASNSSFGRKTKPLPYLPLGPTPNFKTDFGDIEIGDTVTLTQFGEGEVNIVAAVGVTIRSEDDLTIIFAKYTSVTLVYVGVNEWLLIGKLR